jgi:hypothetical protein
MGVKPPCSIFQLIPWFPNDLKARLLDEIANTTTKSSAVISSLPQKDEGWKKKIGKAWN